MLTRGGITLHIRHAGRLVGLARRDVHVLQPVNLGHLPRACQLPARHTTHVSSRCIAPISKGANGASQGARSEHMCMETCRREHGTHERAPCPAPPSTSLPRHQPQPHCWPVPCGNPAACCPHLDAKALHELHRHVHIRLRHQLVADLDLNALCSTACTAGTGRTMRQGEQQLPPPLPL